MEGFLFPSSQMLRLPHPAVSQDQEGFGGQGQELGALSSEEEPTREGFPKDPRSHSLVPSAFPPDLPLNCSGLPQSHGESFPYEAPAPPRGLPAWAMTADIGGLGKEGTWADPRCTPGRAGLLPLGLAPWRCSVSALLCLLWVASRGLLCLPRTLRFFLFLSPATLLPQVSAEGSPWASLCQLILLFRPD